MQSGWVMTRSRRSPPSSAPPGQTAPMRSARAMSRRRAIARERWGCGESENLNLACFGLLDDRDHWRSPRSGPVGDSFPSAEHRVRADHLTTRLFLGVNAHRDCMHLTPRGAVPKSAIFHEI